MKNQSLVFMHELDEDLDLVVVMNEEDISYEVVVTFGIIL